MMISKIKGLFKKKRDITRWPIAFHLVRERGAYGLMGWEWGVKITLGKPDYLKSKWYDLRYTHDIPKGAEISTDDWEVIIPYLCKTGSIKSISESVDDK